MYVTDAYASVKTSLDAKTKLTRTTSDIQMKTTLVVSERIVYNCFISQGCIPVKWTAPEILFGNIAELSPLSDVYV